VSSNKNIFILRFLTICFGYLLIFCDIYNGMKLLNKYKLAADHVKYIKEQETASHKGRGK